MFAGGSDTGGEELHLDQVQQCCLELAFGKDWDSVLLLMLLRWWWFWYGEVGGATLLRESQQGGAGLGLSKHAGRQQQLGGHGRRDPLWGDNLEAIGETYHF